jgi:CheY-like chemotaxis protein
MDRQVEAEFIEEVRDILNGIEVLIGNVRSHASPGGEGLARIRREMVNVAVRGATVDQPLITIIAHRLSEYLGDVVELDSHRLDDIQVFIDQIRRALDGGTEAASVADGAKLVRALPARHVGNFNPADITATNVEIMMVIPDKAMSRIVERELHACGYRVTNVRSPFQAIETIIRTKPDMVIVSAVLNELSGVDVAAALTAMPSTRDLPVAILTSYSWGHPSLADLPTRVPVIRKGANFGDDLAEALSRLRIT